MYAIKIQPAADVVMGDHACTH